MSARLFELLDLAARWIHVVAGIMWIGNSLLFNWLDRNLRPRADADVYGDIWLLHSGGFYLVEKNKGERSADGRRRQPTPLHWFKWQAYTTWLSGAALLVIVYYLGGRALLADPAVSGVGPERAAIIAVATIVGAWAAYEIVWRTVGTQAPGAALAVSLVFLVAAIELLLRTLSGRAAFVHVGAMLGTIMAANVAFTIMPSQRELVAALDEGREPSQAIADRAKHRSIHNNYITFPVIALMLSGHFPSLYAGGATLAQWPLFTIIATGALVRHVLNTRFTFSQWKPALAGALVGGTTLLAVEIHVWPSREAAPATRASSAGVTFADARRVIDRRCAACHSQTPSDVSLGVTPAGVSFDSPAQIQALAARIRERAVVQRTMPPGNRTRITDDERALLAAWIAAGARISP